jgi:cell fate (sporulation/competence/biofilm development) regulator YlbF (YheA/YmcA/DUF963 family)
MDEVIEIAGRLAEAIARNERYAALRSAEKAVQDDADARSLLEAFNEKTMAIVKKEQEMKPVEPSEKREIAALKERIASNETLQALSKAQVDYSEMMNRVNRILFEKLEPKPPE